MNNKKKLNGDASSGRLVVVSNRVPSLQREAAAGGLASALSDALTETGGLWFGWSGETGTSEEVDVVTRQGFALATTDLTRQQADRYYARFANRVLWPLFHGRIDLSAFDQDDYACYRAVNRALAQRLVPLLRPDDVIWIHDYHLIPMATQLRRMMPELRIGFFLHIPVPETDLLRTLPCARELLDDLANYDLVGLQTENDRGNLQNAMERIVARNPRDRTLRMTACPIGIDAQRFADIAASDRVQKLIDQFGNLFQGRKLIVGAERLDYSKGIPQRLRAYEKLIDDRPDLRGQVTLTQIAAPSREVVPEYNALREELETLTGRINALYGDLDWMPVRYFNRSFGRISLAALFRQSRVGLVTPLRDGMNLVAKEYVAAQRPEDPGVLILSTFAGAAERMEGALLVNPYDNAGMVEALARALAMPLGERKARWESMAEEVWTRDVHAWRGDFLSKLMDRRPAASAMPERLADAGHARSGQIAAHALAAPFVRHSAVP